MPIDGADLSCDLSLRAMWAKFKKSKSPVIYFKINPHRESIVSIKEIF